VLTCRVSVCTSAAEVDVSNIYIYNKVFTWLIAGALFNTFHSSVALWLATAINHPIMSLGTSLVELERHTGYVVIRLNRPQRKNAMIGEVSCTWPLLDLGLNFLSKFNSYGFQFSLKVLTLYSAWLFELIFKLSQDISRCSCCDNIQINFIRPGVKELSV